MDEDMDMEHSITQLEQSIWANGKWIRNMEKYVFNCHGKETSHKALF